MAPFIPVKLSIMGHDYALKVDPEEEARLRQAASVLDETMRAIQSPTRPMNPENVAVLAALRIAYAMLEAEEKAKSAAEAAAGAATRDALSEERLDRLLALFEER